MKYYLLLFIAIASLQSVSASDLDSRIADFERRHSRSAVILMEAESGRLEYIYNREYSCSRRFPPGSLIKPISAAVLIDNPSLGFRQSARVECCGKFYLPELPSKGDMMSFNLPLSQGREFFRCALMDGHGSVGFRDALVHSCNVYFLSSIYPHSEEFYTALVSSWHLDTNSGARLASGSETPPVTPKSEPTRFQCAAAGIGEGGLILLSPLKISQLYAFIFSDTPLLSPFEGEKRVVQSGDVSVSRYAKDFLRGALARVINAGTLKGLHSGRVAVIAGKSGTATQNQKRYKTHGWNVIYLSKGGVKYILTTFVYEGSGGREAKELSQIVIDEI